VTGRKAGHRVRHDVEPRGDRHEHRRGKDLFRRRRRAEERFRRAEELGDADVAVDLRGEE
jgi:hypothetical protein